MDAMHTLLGGAIDYAGLFPPAQLGMGDAVANYGAYRQSSDAWALGRFVVPANRMSELVTEHERLPDEARSGPWPLSVLAGPHLPEDLARIAALDAGALRAASLEIRADSADEIRSIGGEVGGYEAYVEIPPDEQTATLIGHIRDAGLRAKVRTGGVTPAAFPEPAAIVRFVAACLAAEIPFKATAGLHHLRTGAYRLTYAQDSGTAPMFGYLNLFAAVAVLRDGASPGDAERALLEGDAGALRLETEALVWENRRIDARMLTDVRRTSLISFGSCSFREPLDELREARAA
jgi:hypothetical protein